MRKLIILSGGQDSVTCLFNALAETKEVEAISFYYGQRHSVELDCARSLCIDLGVPHTIIDVSFMALIGDSALTSENKDVNEVLANGLPATFVPNRNALFLTIAHAHAQKIGAGSIVIGACETDYSGYPDCRRAFLDQMQGALNYGSQVDIKIESPLMWLTKAQTFELAEKLGKLLEVTVRSNTCYKGDRNELHEWGYGCGECPACKLRKKGYEEFRRIRG